MCLYKLIKRNPKMCRTTIKHHNQFFMQIEQMLEQHFFAHCIIGHTGQNTLLIFGEIFDHIFVYHLSILYLIYKY